MYTIQALNTMKGKQLQDICTENHIKKSGKKSELIERIISHQEKRQKEEEEHKRIMDHGAQTRSDTFENIIRAFQMWCDKEGFFPYYGYMTTKRVHIDQIRSAFADYAQEEASLDGFFYMLFNVHDNWEFYDTTQQDREFDCDSMYNSNWLAQGMTEIYNTL